MAPFLFSRARSASAFNIYICAYIKCVGARKKLLTCDLKRVSLRIAAPGYGSAKASRKEIYKK